MAQDSGPFEFEIGDPHERERVIRHHERIQSEDEQRRQEDMELQATTAYLCLRLGDFYIRSGKIQRGIAEYKRAVKMDQDNAFFRTRLGDAYLLRDLIDQAMAQFRKAVQSDPELPEPRISLGDLYRRFGVNVQALGQHRVAAAAGPKPA